MSKRIVLIALLIVGLAASSFVVGKRARVESRNKAVELVVDYAEVQQLAATTGTDFAEVLRRFKDAGATSAAVTEQTMGDVIADRSVVPISPYEYATSRERAGRIARHLRMALPHVSENIQHLSPGGASYGWLTLDTSLPVSYVDQLPIGLPADDARSIRDAGLQVIGRLVNYPGASPAGIQAGLADAKSLGVKTVIFSGDQVLGFKGGVDSTAQAFRNHGLYFGTIEFARQKGEDKLARKAPDNVVVVHSVNPNEMFNLSQTEVVERFQKAVRERGVRLLYVRMYDTSSPDLLYSNLAYVNNIARGVQAAGYTLKPAYPLAAYDIPVFVRAAVGVGVAAGAVLLLSAVFDLSAAGFLLWLLPALAVCAGLAAVGDAGRKAVALLAAAVFPTLAALAAIRGAPETPVPSPAPLVKALGRLAWAIAITTVGGAMVVGLLSTKDFMLRIDQFAGVKLAHLLPILLLVVLFAGGIAWRRDAWAAQRRKLVDSFAGLARDPVLMWQAAVGAALLGVIAVMVVRSGNEGPQVSGVELRLRSILDTALLVRPRTKEFLIGYPALLVGVAFAMRGHRRWAAPLVVVGVIGLVSALNTFCHIHTPLAVSALRVINGALLGAIVGVVAYWIVRCLPGREK